MNVIIIQRERVPCHRHPTCELHPAEANLAGISKTDWLLCRWDGRSISSNHLSRCSTVGIRWATGVLGYCAAAVRQFPVRENFNLKDGTLFSFPVFLLSPSLPCQHHALWTPGPIQHRVHPWFQLQELSRGLSYGTSVPFFASRDK